MTMLQKKMQEDCESVTKRPGKHLPRESLRAAGGKGLGQENWRPGLGALGLTGKGQERQLERRVRLDTSTASISMAEDVGPVCELGVVEGS